MARDLSAYFIRSILDYEPDIGLMRWKYREDMGPRWNGRWPGQVAGSPDEKGYIRVQISYGGLKRYYMAHVLAWLWMTADWPPKIIDHRDTNPSNNRWVNLRLATRAENGGNMKMHPKNKSGFKGVSWHKASNSWVAQIKVENTMKHLGCFDNPEAAHVAYMEAAMARFGEFARSR